MDVNIIKTPEEGRKLIQEIQRRTEELELEQKEVELNNYFKEIGILDSRIDLGYICYMAIYVNNCIGGIVKVKLNKREYDSHLYKFYFVGVDNELDSEKFKHWKVVSRPEHPYYVNYNMLGPKLLEPIIYSNVDNIRKVKFFQLK